MLTLTMFSVITRFLGFIYKIYLSRIMSTTELGIYNLTFSVFMVLITLVASSIPLTISKITSSNKSINKEHKTSYSVTSSLIVSTIVSILLVLIVLLCKPLIILLIGDNLGYEIIIALLPSIIFSALYSQIRGYLWGIENYFSVSIVEFLEQLLRIGLCIVFIYLNIFNSPVIAVGVALSTACGLSTFYGFYLYFKNGGKFKYKKGYFKEIIDSSLPLTGVRVFSSLLPPIVAILIPILLSKLGMDRDLALSELGIIMGMSMPLLSVPSTIIASLCMILIPRISSCDEKSKQKRLHIQIENYILFTLICGFIFIPIFIVLGIPVCDFIFNNSKSGIYLCYSTWIIIPMALAQISSSILNGLNQERKSFIYYLISSVFLLISVFILPKYIQIMAMSFAIGISNTVLTILNFRKISLLINYKPKLLSKLVTHMLLCLPVILITKLSFNWIHIFCNNLITIIFCSIISLFSYIMFLFVFNVIKPKTVTSFLNKNFKLNLSKPKNKI